MTDMIQTDIITYLEGAIPPGAPVTSIDLDTDLIAAGVIDSFGIVGIVGFIEEQYGIEVSDDDINPEIFRNVLSIEAYVENSRAAQK
jgi:acyl carrier protein